MIDIYVRGHAGGPNSRGNVLNIGVYNDHHLEAIWRFVSKVYPYTVIRVSVRKNGVELPDGYIQRNFNPSNVTRDELKSWLDSIKEQYKNV